VLEALKTAFVQTAKRVINSKFDFEAQVDEDTKKINVVQIITVVADDDERLEDEEISEGYITVSGAKEIYEEEVELGDQIQIPHNLEDHGRSAASQLHREIEYHIQRVVEDEVYNKYKCCNLSF
jgi:N utilization substance protein A